MQIFSFKKRHFSSSLKMNDDDDDDFDRTNPFFTHTSDRWLYNEHLRLSERRFHFNLNELCNIITNAVGLPRSDLTLLKKHAEGGSYRIFEATFRDGMKVIARLPYPCTIPRKYGIESEVATMEFLRMHGVPIPKILGWDSSASSNSLGSEYMIMERVPGRELADTWYAMTPRERMVMVERIVEVERVLFGIRFPASGSVFFTESIDPSIKRVEIPEMGRPEGAGRFCIGPSTEYLWWYQRRDELAVSRGPWESSEEVLRAVGERETAWLRRFGQKRYPREAFYREFYGHRKVDPEVQIHHLQNYLKVAPHLVPEAKELTVPTIRHPDLSPSNILVSESGDITGLIDWQYTTVLPLFLQAKIPKHFQNYGDDDSENFRPPKLAHNFVDMSDSEKEAEMETYRRRQVHYFYLGCTSQLNKAHFNAMKKHSLVLRHQLYDVATRPWEGDNTSLQAQLIQTIARWTELSSSKDSPPIHYSSAEVEECLDRAAKQRDVDEKMQRLREYIGVNIDGVVLKEEFESARERAALIKEEMMNGASTEEKREFEEHWPFQDHEEID